MDNLLTCKPIYNCKVSETPKKKIIYKFKIFEEKKESNHSRNNYIINLNSLSQRFSSNSKSVKVKEFLPLINIKKILNFKRNSPKKEKIKNENNNIKLNKRYQSKEVTIGDSFYPNNKKIYSILSNTIIQNRSTTLTETINTIKEKKINLSAIKKNKIYFDQLPGENKKSELKLIKLNKINSNIKQLLEDSVKIDSINNKINITNAMNSIENNKLSQKDKLVIGSKYLKDNISPDSISKNIYYSRLNAFCQKSEKKKIKKKINSSKLDLHNLKLKNYHNQKIKKYKKLINSTVEEVTELKKGCLNWVNELKEKYNDLNKGLGVSSDDEI